MDQILRLTKVQPNYTFPFTSALSQYVVRDYLTSKASAVQRETRTCCAEEMTTYLSISIYNLTHACCSTRIPPALMVPLSIFFFSPFLCSVLRSPGLVSTTSYPNYEGSQLQMIHEPRWCTWGQPGECAGLTVWAGSVCPGLSPLLPSQWLLQ